MNRAELTPKESKTAILLYYACVCHTFVVYNLSYPGTPYRKIIIFNFLYVMVIDTSYKTLKLFLNKLHKSVHLSGMFVFVCLYMKPVSCVLLYTLICKYKRTDYIYIRLIINHM